MVIKLLYIALGSGLGGVCRYLLSKIVNEHSFSSFPWSTFIVNVIGCFIIGILYALIDKGCQLSEYTKLFLTVGFCGGFTTFSTFAHENYLLFQSSNFVILALYASLSFFTGLIAVYCGYILIRGMSTLI